MNDEQRREVVGAGPSGSALFRHLDDDEIDDALRFALEKVAELEPPDDLRGHVFNAAWGARTRYYGDLPGDRGGIVRAAPRMIPPRGQG